MDDDLFLPNKELNELRRDVLAQMENMLLAPYRRKAQTDSVLHNVVPKQKVMPLCMRQRYLHIEVRTAGQLNEIYPLPQLHSVYLSSDSITSLSDAKKNAAVEQIASKAEQLRRDGVSVYITLPPVCRQKTMKIIEAHRSIFEQLSPDGFCVGNLESLAYIRQMFPRVKLVAGPGLYLFNTKTAEFYEKNDIYTHILAYELHRKEIKALTESSYADEHGFILPVYGYIPVMESAGCVLKTSNACRNAQGEERVILTDRHRKQRVVLTHCDRCENTIYNSVPLSLHKESERIFDMNLHGIMLKFTVESEAETKRVITCFMHSEVPVSDFTKGHFLKGVE